MPWYKLGFDRRDITYITSPLDTVFSLGPLPLLRLHLLNRMSSSSSWFAIELPPPPPNYYEIVAAERVDAARDFRLERPLRMHQWVIAISVIMADSSVAPWVSVRCAWYRLVSRLLSACATHRHGAWYPYGRMSQGLLESLRRHQNAPLR